MRLTVLMLLIALMWTSCGKDDPAPAPAEDSMTATVNGESFTATTTTATFIATTIDYEDLGEQETRILTIVGTIPSVSGATKTITLGFGCAELTSDLDYESVDSDCGLALSYNETSLLNPAGAVIVMASEGGVVIEEVTDDKIKGTFTFKGEYNGTTYNITNGAFNAKINQ